MESLNLLRYLIIRDKVTENQVRTGYPSWVFALFFVYIFFLCCHLCTDRDLDRAL